MFDKSKYTIGWICAIRPELIAALIHLDKTHDKTDYESPPADSNTYVFGSIGRHNVVIASLPAGDYGEPIASTVARDLIRSFNNVKIGLMVGIAGGAPLMEDGEEKQQDIRLGDVVVSTPVGQRGGVIHYDRGKSIQDQKFQQTGHLNAPPDSIRTAIGSLRAQMDVDGISLDHAVTQALVGKPQLHKEFLRPERESDRLYVSKFIHADELKSCTSICNQSEHMIHRYLRNEQDNTVAIHFGLVASADRLMKNAILRNQFAREDGVLCFETEAAGLMNQMPFLIIRGICDYADTHKNKDWQGYAAMTAAAYARKLLFELEPSRVEHETAFQEIKTLIESHQSTLERTLDDVNQIREAVDSQQQQTLDQNVLRWLSAPDETTNYEKASRVRHEGSGRWLIENEDFQTRIKTQPLLWMHGDTGCGKTVLATSLIDHLEDSSDESSVTLYFFFDFQDVHKQSCKGMLRSLIKQAYLKMTCDEQPLNELFDCCRAGSLQPSEENLAKCLSTMFETCEQARIHILLDALDECTTQREVFRWLARIQDLDKQPYIIITSCHEREIQRYMESRLSAEAIQAIDRATVHEDIKEYVKQRIRSDQGGFSRWRDQSHVLEMIESSLAERSGGMFRWAACQLDTLEDCISPRMLTDALDDLPQDLEETYSRILDTIPRQYEPETIRILQLLAYSHRPLTCRELVDALAVTTTIRPAFDPSHRLPDPDDLRKAVSSLVSYTSVTVDEFCGQEKAMQLAHSSIKEYLLSARVHSRFAGNLGEKIARMTISKICVSYLLSLDHELDIEAYSKQYALARYSALTWPLHAASVADQDDEHLRKMIKELLTSSQAFKRVRSLNPRWPSSFTSIICAADAGLDSAVQDLLDLGVELSERRAERRFCTALIAASQQGHTNIVKLLLERGADPNEPASSHSPWTALLVASTKKHFKIVKLLLESGADPNRFSQSSARSTPLLIALQESKFDIVELLLDKGADPKKHKTANSAQPILRYAAGQGHLKLVQLMLNIGAKLNHIARDAHRHGLWNTALSAASGNGHFKLVEWLLQKNAVSDKASSGCPYVSALYAASSKGHTKIVSILLANGANPGAHVNGMDDNSALEAASHNGHLEIMQLLLARIQNMAHTHTSEHLCAAIESASKSSNNNIDAVRLLLASSPDPFEPDRLFPSLMHASGHGHNEIVQALLDGDRPFTPNQLFEATRKAARKSHVAVFGLLLNAGGGHFSVQNLSEELYHAASCGKAGLTRLLVAAGRGVFVLEHFKFALTTSADAGHLDVVRLLLNASRRHFSADERRVWLARASGTVRLGASTRARMPQPLDVILW